MSKLTFRFTATSEPDNLGRQSFDLDWTDQFGRRRGQCFFANPDVILARLRKDGHTLEAA